MAQFKSSHFVIFDFWLLFQVPNTFKKEADILRIIIISDFVHRLLPIYMIMGDLILKQTNSTQVSV